MISYSCAAESIIVMHSNRGTNIIGTIDRYNIIPYPRERGPTTECRPTPHFELNFLLRSSVYSNMHPCEAAFESTVQMHEMAGLYFE